MLNCHFAWDQPQWPTKGWQNGHGNHLKQSQIGCYLLHNEWVWGENMLGCMNSSEWATRSSPSGRTGKVHPFRMGYWSLFHKEDQSFPLALHLQHVIYVLGKNIRTSKTKQTLAKQTKKKTKLPTTFVVKIREKRAPLYSQPSHCAWGALHGFQASFSEPQNHFPCRKTVVCEVEKLH